MKTTNRHKLTLLFGIILVMLTFGMTLKAQLPSPPVPPRLVNDYTGTLTASQIEALERKLVAYDDSTSTQILVMLVDDLQGMSIEQYATEIGHSWGVGQKDKGNGAVILVKPKKGTERGQVNISPGYGMEQYVTDATAKSIIDREMIPAFKEDDYYTGIDNAVNTIMDLCSGKFTQDEYSGEEGFPLWLIILFIIAIAIIFSKFSDNNGQNYSGGGTRTIWIPMGGGGFGGGGG
ncbi:MAG: TPM domain-containing protein, partial [bacterium]|nr:TPM domain-containing protein [bacterium]